MSGENNEIWRDIKGYEGLYQVSNLGRVKGLIRKVPMKNGRIKNITKITYIKPCLINSHYLTVRLSKNHKYEHRLIHRLVAEAFIPNNRDYKYVNHKDENKLNNNANNLEWCTPQYNATYGTGLLRRKPLKNRKDMSTRIIAIKNGIETEYPSLSECARCLKVDRSNITNTLKGRQKTTKGYVFVKKPMMEVKNGQ